MNYQKFSLFYGFSLWLFASLPFSLAGNQIFLTENLAVMLAFYLGAVPLLYFLIIPVFRRFKLSYHERVKSAVLMALPGLFLDVWCIQFHQWVFPTLSVEAVNTLGSWILWNYAIAISIGLWESRKSPLKIKI